MSETEDNALLLFNWFEQCEKENILLSFKGDFNEELVSAILLLADREPDMQNSSALVRARVFSILVECMQNIRKYGVTNEQMDEFKPGIVLVCRDIQSYSLKVGNLMDTAKVPELKEHIEYVSSMDKEGLKKLHKKVLSHLRLSEKSGAGLGFITIMRKCDQFTYDFRKLSDKITFFSLDIHVSLTNS